MKIKTLFSKSIQRSLLIALIFLSACKKDEGLNSSELLVYVPGEYGSVNSTYNLPLTHTPVSVWGNTTINFSAYATREVPAAVDVYIFPDTLVAQFNKANNTNYLLLPASSYKIVNGNKHTISQGKLVSDSIRIDITDATSLMDPRGYVLPLTIKNIEGQDKGVRISTNQSTVYITLPYTFTNVDSTQTPSAPGTVMSRTAWAVTVSGSSSGTANQASNLLDGSNSTYWRSNSSTTATKTVTVNMGSMQTVNGFRISPNYTSTAENATQMTVSTSSDNVTFTVQGIWKGTTFASTSSVTSPDIKGVNFITPVAARYFKFDITGWPSAGIVGMAEINAVQ